MDILPTYYMEKHQNIKNIDQVLAEVSKNWCPPLKYVNVLSLIFKKKKTFRPTCKTRQTKFGKVHAPRKKKLPSISTGVCKFTQIGSCFSPSAYIYTALSKLTHTQKQINEVSIIDFTLQHIYEYNIH